MTTKTETKKPAATPSKPGEKKLFGAAAKAAAAKAAKAAAEKEASLAAGRLPIPSNEPYTSPLYVPFQVIDGERVSAIRIFDTTDTETVRRVSRTLRKAGIRASMRRVKYKNHIRLFVPDKQIVPQRDKLEAMIDKAIAEPETTEA